MAKLPLGEGVMRNYGRLPAQHPVPPHHATFRHPSWAHLKSQRWQCILARGRHANPTNRGTEYQEFYLFFHFAMDAALLVGGSQRSATYAHSRAIEPMTDGTTARADTSAINASDPSRQELEESIDQLAAYRDRLVKDVIGMGQRLKLPQKQVEFTLAQHPELQKIESILAQLEAHKSEQD
jgi:hypothetical protein